MNNLQMNNLQKLLKTQGRTLSWLSKKTQLSTYKLRGIIKNKRHPNIIEMIKISEAFEIPPELIFFAKPHNNNIVVNQNAFKTHCSAPGAKKNEN